MMASELKSARLPRSSARERPVAAVAPEFGKLGWISRLVLGLATIMALAATFIMILEGFSRYALDVSYFWAEESVRFLMVWAFFLTLGIAGFRNYHIRTELLVQRLPRPVQRVVWLVSCVAGMLFAFILAYSSIPQVHRFYTMGMVSESSLELPMWLLFLAMPVGGLALFAYYACAAWYAWRWGDPFAPQAVDENPDPSVAEAIARQEPLL
ncbi:TRAP transporter small permease [Bordetella sp. 15P40C-2]|uniref:TRAP transporter small permease n=1 Tax=Bordetella sp. 15P40C-2 TaxID=2572246 RepID=UPI0013207262|nr:TRAP transporter small permease [Bordetella sp. 15P40C-2]MVW69928.1 TRAP transporter small permease subunit [Bordetella sp. 15P40C-2]